MKIKMAMFINIGECIHILKSEIFSDKHIKVLKSYVYFQSLKNSELKFFCQMQRWINKNGIHIRFDIYIASYISMKWENLNCKIISSRAILRCDLKIFHA